jgi:hypothetical protein
VKMRKRVGSIYHLVYKLEVKGVDGKVWDVSVGVDEFEPRRMTAYRLLNARKVLRSWAARRTEP